MARVLQGFRSFVFIGAALVVAGCGAETRPPNVPLEDPEVARYRAEFGELFGPEGLTFSTNGRPSDPLGAGGIGVNAFLWRASLDTLDFMPLSSADPFGGVIITDWYEPASAAAERLKVNVFILDRQLRADALKVTVFRQIRGDGAEWRDAPVEAGLARRLEDTVLTRARELRLASG